MKDYLISPNPKDKLLTEKISGIDQDGGHNKLSVTVERPLTLFLNGQEIEKDFDPSIGCSIKWKEQQT